jgi:hypothetical protein
MVAEGPRKSTAPCAPTGVAERLPDDCRNVISNWLVSISVRAVAWTTEASAWGEGGDVTFGLAAGDAAVVLTDPHAMRAEMGKVSATSRPIADLRNDLTGTVLGAAGARCGSNRIDIHH